MKLVPTVSLGLLFGWLYSKTRSIWLGVFGHVLNNSLGFFLIYIGSKAKTAGDATSSQTIGVELAFSAVGLALVLYGIGGLQRVLATVEPGPEPPTGPPIFEAG